MTLFSVGAGLITTFDLGTPFARWFGYQVIAGLGIGCGFQAGVLVIQTVLPLHDIPIGTALVQFSQSLGGAIFISVAQTLFSNGLIAGIELYAPSLDPQIFLHSGATAIRGLLVQMGQEDQLDGLLRAYVLALNHVFYITVACAMAAFFCATGLQWKSVKARRAADAKAGAAERREMPEEELSDLGVV